MKVDQDTYVGAVTAVTYSPDEQYIVYGKRMSASRLSSGSGATLYIYDAKQFHLLKTIRSMSRALIHGIRIRRHAVRCALNRVQSAVCIRSKGVRVVRLGSDVCLWIHANDSSLYKI